MGGSRGVKLAEMLAMGCWLGRSSERTWASTENAQGAHPFKARTR